MTQRQGIDFTCPKCGNPYFGSATTISSGEVTRYCHGVEGLCDFKDIRVEVHAGLAFVREEARPVGAVAFDILQAWKKRCPEASFTHSEGLSLTWLIEKAIREERGYER